MNNIRVQISHGILKGRRCVTDHGFHYNSFQGIPYAKPPLGDLRFKDPEPANPWEGEYDATFERDINPQYDMLLQNSIGNEDSLHVNVYAPQVKDESELLPVMIWIHGGAYCMGSGNTQLYGPDFLIEQNIILVTFNYRLGALGFLCLHTDDVPGNAGMKDQVLALKWTKKNISKFGGDDNNVTIFGHSAGGASTQFHIVSPMAKGLFNKTITQSGTCLSGLSLLKNPEKKAFSLAEKLGFESSSKEEVIEFLRSVPVEQLILISDPFMNGFDLDYCPVIEKKRIGKESFITENPHQTLKSGQFNKVPTITGCVGGEGIFFYEEYCKKYGEENLILDILVPDFKYLVPDDVKENSKKSLDIIANEIKHFYFSNGNNLKENYINMMSNFVFVKPIDDSIKFLSENSPPAYYYLFSYVGAQILLKLNSKSRQYDKAAHGDELSYLFKMNIFNNMIHLSESDTVIMNSMLSMWTDFAKHGNPTPQESDISIVWKPVTKTDVNCLEINETIREIKEPFSKNKAFWETLGKESS